MTMKTAIAISPTIRNVLSVAMIPPAAVKASQMARITARIVPMIRPMYPVCALAAAPSLHLCPDGQLVAVNDNGPAITDREPTCAQTT